MKAPDKIYIAAQTFPNEIDWDGSPISTKKVEDTDVQYIRKDALLKWLESMVYQHNEHILAAGFNTAIEQVIDKLNSL